MTELPVTLGIREYRKRMPTIRKGGSRELDGSQHFPKTHKGAAVQETSGGCAWGPHRLSSAQGSTVSKESSLRALGLLCRVWPRDPAPLQRLCSQDAEGAGAAGEH